MRLALHIGESEPAAHGALLPRRLWRSPLEIIRQSQDTKAKGIKTPHALLGNTVLHKALTRSSL